jgi:hypothetical protein
LREGDAILRQRTLVILNGIQYFLAALNAVAAYSNWPKHLWLVGMNAGVAIFCLVLAIRVTVQHIRLRRVERELEELMPTLEGQCLANEHLKRVVALVGGSFQQFGVVFETHGINFLVRANEIYRYQKGVPFPGDNTCYQIAEIPYEEEKMATAILLLHADPALFEFWRDNHGEYTARLKKRKGN